MDTKPKEFDYWVELEGDPKGNVMKYQAGSSKWLISPYNALWNKKLFSIINYM